MCVPDQSLGSEIKSRLKLDHPTGQGSARFPKLLIADWSEAIAAGDERSVVEKSEAGQVQVIENIKEVESKIQTRSLAEAGYAETLREAHIYRRVFRPAE